MIKIKTLPESPEPFKDVEHVMWYLDHEPQLLLPVGRGLGTEPR